MLMFAKCWVPEENITIISFFFMFYFSLGWWELKYNRPIYEDLPTLWFLNLIFSPRKCFWAIHLPKITDSGLYFAKNRPKTHFLRDFMIIWLSVELASRAKIWGSHPQFRFSTPFSSREHAINTNISLNFTFPGFTLLENDQKCTFYAILWDDMEPLEIRQASAKKIFFF